MNDWFPYGLDAPPVVRNLLLAALACFSMFALGVAGWLPAPYFGWPWLWPALSFACTALAMIWSSRWGKLHRRERLLDRLAWRGDEWVLDLGCGRGLLAVAAAQRVPHGHVVGVDIWHREDLSGNGPEAVLANASREGVADRVKARTADLRDLPFDAGVVDTAVSSTAIHNIYDPVGRVRAVAEIVRVLKPGGQVLIDDIRHVHDYAAQLRAAGFAVTVGRGFGSWFWRVASFGAIGRATLSGRKPPAN